MKNSKNNGDFFFVYEIGCMFFFEVKVDDRYNDPNFDPKKFSKKSKNLIH